MQNISFSDQHTDLNGGCASLKGLPSCSHNTTKVENRARPLHRREERPRVFQLVHTRLLRKSLRCIRCSNSRMHDLEPIFPGCAKQDSHAIANGMGSSFIIVLLAFAMFAFGNIAGQTTLTELITGTSVSCGPSVTDCAHSSTVTASITTVTEVDTTYTTICTPAVVPTSVETTPAYVAPPVTTEVSSNNLRSHLSCCCYPSPNH